MLLPKLKLKTLPTFPSVINGGVGIDVARQNGALTVDLDYSEFGVISAIPTSPTSYILTYDTVTQSYVMVPSHLLGGGVSGISDAPNDGNLYGRESTSWTLIPPDNFIQAGASAVIRTMQDKARDIVSIKDFGGAGDGATDNTAPLNHALASLTGSGGCIYFPPGKYQFNSPVSFTFPSGLFSVTILGGGEENTVLMWANASGGMVFTYRNEYNSIHVHDLSLTTAANGTASGSALTLVSNETSPNTAGSDIYRVTMRGDDGYLGNACWGAGLNISDVSNINVEKLLVVGDASLVKGIGIQMSGKTALSAYAVGLNVAKSGFLGLNIGILYGGYAQGFTVNQSNFGSCQYGITAQPSESGGPFGLDQLAVTNCHFNNYVSDISLGTSINNVFISNTYFLKQFNNSIAVALQVVGAFSIDGNSFNGVAGTGTIGIQVGTNTAAGIINGNLFTGFSGAALLLQAGSTNINIEANSFFGGGATIISAATTNTHRIQNNSGYNPIGASNISVTASPFTYTAGPSPETVYIRTGGTISLITIGGVGIAAAAAPVGSPITIELGPNESCVTTYAGATPAMVKMIH